MKGGGEGRTDGRREQQQYHSVWRELVAVGLECTCDGGGRGFISVGRGLLEGGASRSSGGWCTVHQAGQKLRWCGEGGMWARHLFVVGIARA